jgi:hypothetical protein
MRHATSEMGRRISSAMKDMTDGDKHPDDARLDRLDRLGELKASGVLNESEFEAEKKKVLSG